MGQPAWFGKEKSIKQTANEKEAKVYKHLNSGALSFKGDFSTKNSCIDLKSTKHKSIRVTSEMLEKLQSDALTMGKQNSILILDLPEYYVVCKVERKDEI